MNRVLPTTLDPLIRWMTLNAGFLWTIRKPRGHTCEICAVPIDSQYSRCYWCTSHIACGISVADRVGISFFAVLSDQTYRIVHDYKAPSAAVPVRQRFKAMLTLGIVGHSACLVRLLGDVPDAWAVVPSTRRRGVHPLREIASAVLGGLPEILVAPTAQIVNAPESQRRALNTANFIVNVTGDPPSTVLLIEDSWVQGGHAQSVAAALKSAGVRTVAIFCVARVLNPSFGVNPEFIRSSERVFDPLACPWTLGGRCPVS